MLTDLVIGFWTTAWILDVAGRRRDQHVADAFVALGVVTFVPTAITGWADWTERSPSQQRVGVVHAATNGAAVTVYAASWVARRRGSRALGVALGHMGATIATVGGYLGGHLAFPPEESEPLIERSN